MTSRSVPLVVLRHGPTDWNAEGRIQGRSDRPLSEAGRAAVRRWSLPDECSGYDWVTSPLLRARETAALMGHGDAVIEAALIEAGWGRWEGRNLGELRDCYGAEMVQLEARGLDFRPPGGESPRDVQARLAPWLARVTARRAPCVAVCHKGVIRALAALASGWDMTGPPPEKLRDSAAHRFVVDAGGMPAVERLNLPLVS
jgi:probable phosphoglycerate mutase